MIRFNYIILLAFSFSSQLLAQNKFEAGGGINGSNFFCLNNSLNYSNKYIKDYSYSLFISYYKYYKQGKYRGVEIENSQISSQMIINYNAGHASYFHNATYDLGYIFTYLNFENIIINKHLIKLYYEISPCIGYLIKSHVKSNGWNYSAINQVDSLGFVVPNPTIRYWEKDESNSSDITKLFWGGRISIKINFYISEKIKLSMKSNFRMGFNNVLLIDNAPYTNIRSLNYMFGINYLIE